MDGNRLDEISKALAAARGRRGFLRALAGGLLGLAAGTVAQPRWAAAQTQGAQACMSWCQQNFPPMFRTATPDCGSLAASGQGPCFACGPAAPAQHPDLCGQACCPAATPTCCSGACTDTQTDAKNCGACGNACPSTQQCLGGVCTSGAISQPTLPSGQPCNANSACASGNCSSGICCPAGQTNCSGTCVNTSTDAANCGGCNSACVQPSTTSICPPTSLFGPTNCTNVTIPPNVTSVSCVSGVCTPVCAAGFAHCGTGNTGCETNISSDVDNCGGCNSVCATSGSIGGSASVACVNGKCTPTCPTGQSLCSGACVNTSTDSSNCGNCGTVCGSGTTCSNGSCTGGNGISGQQCSGNAGCTSGNCTNGRCCPAGQSYCTSLGGNAACVDTRSDVNNCGTCGNACLATAGQPASCVNGTCGALTITVTCPSGYANCGPSFGCITNLNTDPNNCGVCGHACVSIPPVKSTVVQGAYTSNGTASTCINGTCVATTCTGDRFACGNSCVDVGTDPNNCGGCGNVCGTIQACSLGTCVSPSSNNNCGSTSCFGGDFCCTQGGTSRCCGFGQTCLGYTNASGNTQPVCCAAGQVVCNGTCTTLGTISNCLSCGDSCGDPQFNTCCPGLGCRSVLDPSGCLSGNP